MMRILLLTFSVLMTLQSFAQDTLVRQKIGTSGNPFTAIDNGTNNMDYNADIDALIFIHRTNRQNYPNDDRQHGQYRYDVSYDYGQTWVIDNGVLNPSGSEDSGTAARFPQALIYNPTGNTNPNNAYLTYQGTFHDGSSTGTGIWEGWNGIFTGRARLDNDTTTFTEDTIFANDGDVNVFSGFTQSRSGKFWTLSREYTSTDRNSGVVLMEGDWNGGTMDIDWSLNQVFKPGLDLTLDGTGFIYDLRMDWDPSGRYGWIYGTGDLTNDGEYIFDPFLYYTKDSGASWTGPVIIDVDSLVGVEAIPGYEGIEMTTGLDASIVVDGNGMPAIFCVIYPHDVPDYIVFNGSDGWVDGTKAYMIRLDSTANKCADWFAVPLADIRTSNGIIRGTSPNAVAQGYHSKASKTADGSKIFFSWTDTDPGVTGGTENEAPDLFSIAFDVDNNMLTEVYEWTDNDPLFNDASLWPSMCRIATDQGTYYNVQGVLGEFIGGITAAYDDPVQWYAISNLDYPKADFTVSIDRTKPTVTLIGDNPIWIQVGNNFNDPGVNTSDCFQDTVDVNVSTNLDVNTYGEYDVTYIATDSAGNSDTVVRKVIVAGDPTANFTHTPNLSNPCRILFSDASDPAVDNLTWNFGDGFIDNTDNKNPVHNYTAPGQYPVTLQVSNPFGSDDTTVTVSVVDVNNCTVGINDVNSDRYIRVYPNPANEMVVVQSPYLAEGTAQIELLNLVGQKIAEVAIKSTGDDSVQLDLSQVPTGVYLVKIETEKGFAVKRLTVNQ